MDQKIRGETIQKKESKDRKRQRDLETSQDRKINELKIQSEAQKKKFFELYRESVKKKVDLFEEKQQIKKDK